MRLCYAESANWKRAGAPEEGGALLDREQQAPNRRGKGRGHACTQTFPFPYVMLSTGS